MTSALQLWLVNRVPVDNAWGMSGNGQEEAFIDRNWCSESSVGDTSFEHGDTAHPSCIRETIRGMASS